jgi:hypothetical protein
VTGPAGPIDRARVGSPVGVTVDAGPVADRPLSNSSQVSPGTELNPPARGLALLEIRENAFPGHRSGINARPAADPGTAWDRARTMPISADPASIGQDSSTVVSKSFGFVTPPGAVIHPDLVEAGLAAAGMQ